MIYIKSNNNNITIFGLLKQFIRVQNMIFKKILKFQ